MRPWILYLILLASSVCQLVGLVMFAKGFFPYKSISTAFATMDDLPVLPSTGASLGANGLGDNGSIRPRYGKVVLMLVDALRSDFLYGNESDFSFVQSLINSNQALPFTALASAPTVTLPRLKALTTGTVPSFLDAILNIAESDQSSTLANQDNWVAQLTRSKSLRKDHDKELRNIGFFGDDTWIKLFPGQFFRSEGTSSFFAMDTVEVDNNVTRHVPSELAKDDWDALIFHYLGLDHVGHSGGPKSGLMRPKQAEMDSIVKTIHNALVDQHQEDELPTLFILCGDHGMNEVGNHGGSSRSEISTAFLFMSPHFQQSTTSTRIKAMMNPHREEYVQDQEEYLYYKSVNQVDLVPTISLLLGLPIPKNSVGKLIPELFDEYSDLEKLRALQINAFQVAEVLKGKWSDFATEAVALLNTYSPNDEQDQDLDDQAFETCARMDSEKQRLSCWYTEALAAHATLLEMNVEDSRIHYKDHDKIATFRAAERSYSKFLSDSSSMLSTALSKYDMPLLTNGSLVMAFAVAGFMYCAMQTKLLSDFKRSCREPHAVNVKTSSSTIIYTTPDTAPLPSVSNFAVPKPLLKTPFASLSAGDANEVNWTLARGLSVVIFILYLVTLFASSFVEEEHQFWYFFNMSWWAVLGITSARYLAPPNGSPNRGDFKPYLAAGYCFTQMVILRLLRAWNQTGQKYADQIDLRHYLNSTWLGVSWLMFGATMLIIALSLISLVYNFQQRTKLQFQEASKWSTAPSSPGPVTKMLQALIVILVVLVTLWITLYKMDLESSYFGDQLMSQVHNLMIRISAVGYSQISALPMEERPPLTVSGFELARGCYLGLGLILVLTLTLKGLDSSLTPSTDISSREGTWSGALTDKNAALKVVQSKPQALFVPGMILGIATLLLVLLSRRHNAPIYILFGVQLWMYIEWISLVRQRPSGSDHQLCQLTNPLVAKRKSNVYVVEPLAQDNDEASSPSAPRSAPILDLAFRTLPGQSSIHSCTALLWILSSFFLLGNSNSIASIDISNAYVGIQAYDIFLTGVLTFVSNWAGPVWWTLATVVMMSWDLEWELAWTAQAAELEHAQEEERAWETVQGWRKAKDDKKLGMSRRTRRQAVREKRWKAVSKEQQSTAAAAAAAAASNIEEGKEDANTDVVAEVESGANGAAIQAKSVQENLESSQADAAMEQSAADHEQVEEEIEYLDEVSSEEPPSATLARLGTQGYRVYLAQTRMLEHLIVSSLFFGITLYALSIAAIVLRHHLFIWTVFSPKVLYQFAWTALFQVVIQTVLVGGGIWALVLFV